MKPIFTEEQKQEIRRKREGGATIMALAVEYNASLSTITRVVDDKYAESVRKSQNARYHKRRAEYLMMKKELEELHGKEQN